MPDNVQLLDKIGTLIDEKLEPLKTDLAQAKTTVGSIKSAVETLAAGQEDIQATVQVNTPP